MRLTVLIPAYLRPYAEGQSQVELRAPARTVEEALAALWELYPGLRDRVLTESGTVRQHVNIFLNEENIRDASGLATPVADGCEIMIVPSVSGG